MSTLLKINASLFSNHGQSSQLTERFVAAWQASHPDTAAISPPIRFPTWMAPASPPSSPSPKSATPSSKPWSISPTR